MDPRVHDHAEVLVDWSARVERGDAVVVVVDEGTHELAVAVAGTLGERGASIVPVYGSDEVTRAYLTAHDGDFEPEPAHERAMVENADVFLSLRGGRNASASADVPADRRRAYARSTEGVRDARLRTRWVSTVHPTRSLAQRAGMSIEAYRDFVYGAILRDWRALASEMDRLKMILDEGSEVRIDAEGTNLVLSIDGRMAVNSAASVAYDSHNLPSGEVFTAPSGAEGEVRFDVPTTHHGTRIEDVHLVLDGGEVVDWSAGRNEDALTAILDTDEGARRLGELGFGMNRGIDRFTDNVLFDEKMAGTVHLALGRSYDACLPAGDSGNRSAVHVDMIIDASENASIEIDGEPVQRNGVFRWEDGFEP